MCGKLIVLSWWELKHIPDLLDWYWRNRALPQTPLLLLLGSECRIWWVWQHLRIFFFIEVVQFILPILERGIVLGAFTRLMWCSDFYFGVMGLRISLGAKPSLISHMSFARLPKTCSMLWWEKEGPGVPAERILPDNFHHIMWAWAQLMWAVNPGVIQKYCRELPICIRCIFQYFLKILKVAIYSVFRNSSRR